MTDDTTSRRKGAERRQGSRRAGFDRRMPERKFLADEYVFREGESAKLCYQIVTGKVGIYKNFHGESKEIVEFTEGDIFGEMALIDNSPRRASAKAKEPTVLKQIHQRAFLDYLSQSPDMAMSIMKRLIAYARSSMDSTESDAVSRAANAYSTDEHLPSPDHISNNESHNRQIIDDFQSPSENLLKQKLPKAISWSLTSILLLTIVTLGWILNTEIDITVSANGTLTSSVTEIPVVNEIESNLISIDVSPGDLIAKGEIIATLNPLEGAVSTADIQASDKLLVTAPLDGLVVQLGQVYPGAKMPKGEKIVTIIPTSLPLSIDLNVSADDLKRITLGNNVSVKIPALPYVNHGDLLAELSYLPNAALLPHDSAKRKYQAQAVIKSNNLKNLPDNFRLIPGMPVTGDIVIAKRTLLDYFLYPVIDTFNRSFTEP